MSVISWRGENIAEGGEQQWCVSGTSWAMGCEPTIPVINIKAFIAGKHSHLIYHPRILKKNQTIQTLAVNYPIIHSLWINVHGCVK